VEVVRLRIRLERLPEAFEGFHIAHLSDVHIGPFTTADYIRRCVAMPNALLSDVIALTGDQISWDRRREQKWFTRWRACARPAACRRPVPAGPPRHSPDVLLLPGIENV